MASERVWKDGKEQSVSASGSNAVSQLFAMRNGGYLGVPARFKRGRGDALCFRAISNLAWIDGMTPLAADNVATSERLCCRATTLRFLCRRHVSCLPDVP